MAASTASRPSVPEDAHKTMSTSGCDATATRPVAAGSGDLDRHAGLSQSIDRAARGHGHDPWPVARDLRRQQIHVLASGEADDPQPVRVSVDNGQRALSNRAGGAEDRDVFHVITSTTEHTEKRCAEEDTR